MQEHTSQQTTIPVEFRGNTREWFGIWIVNLVLSIITIGIYSAWAKVRTKKYFYQNTYVAGRNFDYHATGKQILIGRLIVIAGLVVFGVLSTIPAVAILGFLVLLVAIPWLVVQSLRFNSRVSSWSNVRFAFHGAYGGAAKITLLYPILAALTAYLGFPFADRARRRWIIDNHSLGKTRFNFSAKIGGFYRAALAALVWVLVIGAVIAAIVMQSGVLNTMFAGFDPESAAPPEVELGFTFGIYGAFFLILAPAGAIYYAMARNIVFNNSTLGSAHGFSSTVPPLKYLWIVMTNAVAIICTLGLLLPWAQIRKAKFLATHSAMLVGGSLDDFIGDIQGEDNAVGDAYSDIEGLDLDIGI